MRCAVSANISEILHAKGLEHDASKFYGKHALGQNGEAATEPYCSATVEHGLYWPYGIPALHDRCDVSEQRRVVVTPATCPTHERERIGGRPTPSRTGAECRSTIMSARKFRC